MIGFTLLWIELMFDWSIVRIPTFSASHTWISPSPLVSIIVVCYNHVSYVEQCIQSIVEQTYKNIEIIVADDCSTDGSVLLLEELTNKYDFIFLPSIANQGLNSNILKGLDKATGAFIAIGSSHLPPTFWLKNKLQITSSSIGW